MARPSMRLPHRFAVRKVHADRARDGLERQPSPPPLVVAAMALSKQTARLA